MVDGVAPHLTKPPAPQLVPPPGHPPIHELPLGDLHWDDFERLCWRLVALRGDVRQTALYGERGQKQHGIDLYAELRDGSFAVFQCKKWEKMRPADIKAGVDTFLAGPWRGRARLFGFCTRVSLRETKLADAIVAQAERLGAERITFERLDLDEISRRCKTEPEIVWDFFGPEWAKAFCGPQLCDRLRGRLRPDEVVELRDRLREYYLRTFAEHDLSPPPLTGHDVAHLVQRFVLPDIVERRTLEARGMAIDKGAAAQARAALAQAPFGAWRGGSDAAPKPVEAELAIRQPIGPWMADGERTVIVGDSGSGKSTLLRFIACDLLSDEPRLDGLAARWHDHVPVWIPFPSWVRRIAAGAAGTSARDAVSAWLADRDQQDLVPLLHRAFEDGRVVLLVDGLDEYVDDDVGAAKDALARLLVLQAQRGVPLIAAGRPGPSRRLRANLNGMRLAELAPLDIAQRTILIRQWFLARSGGGPGEEPTPDELAGRFLRALTASADAARLAFSPLLLVFVLRVWSETNELPRTRTDLLRQVVDLLVREHPMGRRTASNIPRPGQVPRDEDVGDALACLAFSMRIRGFSLSEDAARDTLREFLQDAERGLGLGRPDARQGARTLLAWLCDHLGVVVVDGGGVTLPHRALLEYLAATWVAGATAAEQGLVVESHGADASWAEVWPDLIALAPDADSAHRLFEALLHLRRREARAFCLDRALGAAALASGPLPAAVRRAFVSHLAAGVRTEGWWPHRADLVRIVARGLLCPSVTSMVHDLLGDWLPRREGWHSGLLAAIGRWGTTPEVTAALLLGLQDADDSYARVAAADALSGQTLDLPPEGLRHRAGADADALTRAAALVAYAKRWPKAPEATSLAEAGLATRSPEIAVACWLLQLQGGETPDLRLGVLALTGADFRLDRAFHPLLCDVLARCWAGRLDRRDEMLRLLHRDSHGRWTASPEGFEVDRDAVFEILVRAFPGDDEVAKYVADRIGSYELPISSSWSLLADHFRRHPLLIGPVDRWLSAHVREFEPDRAYAAIVSGSEIARTAMISDLERGSSPWWPAGVLLDHWSDSRVHDVLAKFVEASPNGASSLGHLLARIWGDHARARTRLLEIIRMPTCYRQDFVIDGLRELDQAHGDIEAGDTICDALVDQDPAHSFAWAAAFAGFLWHPRIEARARSAIGCPEAPLSAIARGAAHAPRMRPVVLRGATPLDGSLRRALWEELAQLGPASTEAQSWLRRYDEEIDPTAKTTAALGWYRSVVADKVSREAAVARLRRDVACRGMEHEARRQAAFAAAIDLGVPEILLGLHTEGMPDHAVSVRLRAGSGGPNAPFLAVVARAWEALEREYGTDLLHRLDSGHLVEPKHEDNIFWSDAAFESLLAQGDGSPALQRWLLDRIEGAERRFGSRSVLTFLSRARPRSRLLRDFCMGTLSRVRPNAYWLGVQFTAAEILADGFQNEDNLRLELEHGPSGDLDCLELARRHPAHIYALSLGWPASELLGELQQRLGDDREMDAFVHGVVTYSRGTPADVLALLERWFEMFESFHPDPGRGLQSALLHRIGSDPELAAALATLTRRSPRHFVSLAPLVGVSGAGQATVELLDEEFTRQVVSESPDLAMDLFTGRVVSVAEVAARMLDGLRGQYREAST